MSTRDERVADLYLTDLTSEGNPTEEGQIRRVSNDLVAYVGGQVKSLTADSGGGISEAAHEIIDSLVHELSETYYLEVTLTSGRVSDVTAWTDSGKTTKVRETNITRTLGQVSQIVKKQYDGTGTLKNTLTYSITRSSGRVSSISVVKT